MHVPARRRSRWLVALGSLLLALVLPACAGPGAQGGGSGGSSGSAAGSVKGKNVVIIDCSDKTPFCKAMHDTLRDRLQAEGVNVKVLEDEHDAATQAQHMSQAIAEKPNAILINVADTASIVPSFARAKAAGVPVINLDGPLSQQGYDLVSYSIEADHAELGKFAAQDMVEGLKAAGIQQGRIIAVTGTMTSLLAQQRMQAFTDYLKAYPQYTLSDSQDANWDQTKATSLAQTLFTKYAGSGGIQGAYGMNDQLAVGIVNAAKQAGVPTGADKLVVVGSNCASVGIDAIKAKEMYGSATQSPVEQANAVADYALKVLKGQSAPKIQKIPEDRITPQNVDQFAQPCTY